MGEQFVMKDAWYLVGDRIVVPYSTGEFSVVDCDSYSKNAEPNDKSIEHEGVNYYYEGAGPEAWTKDWDLISPVNALVMLDYLQRKQEGNDRFVINKAKYVTGRRLLVPHESGFITAVDCDVYTSYEKESDNYEEHDGVKYYYEGVKNEEVIYDWTLISDPTLIVPPSMIDKQLYI